MSQTRTIEVDQDTAERLEAHARKLGLSVSQLVAQMTALDPVEVPEAVIAELDGRMAAIKAGEPTIPNDEVVRWLDTWGMPAFRPWHDR